MNGNAPNRVLVADDEAFARQRIIQLLARERDFQVVSECAHGSEAVQAIRELKPDVVFLDIQMPELDGFGVLEAIGPDHMPPTIFAEAMGCVGLRARNLTEMHEVIEEANRINDVPVVIDFRTDSSEKVFPMVAAGASNDDIMVHPSQRGAK